MEIGIDATCWQNKRGYGRYTRGLLSTLVRRDTENRYTFFMDSSEEAESLPPEVTVRLVRASVPTVRAASANGHRSFGDMWQMSRAMSQAGSDILLFPTIYSYVPLFGRVKKIVMIHDVIAEKYPHLTLASLRGRLFWKAKNAIGRWQADAIATVSDYSRSEIVKQFKLSPERISVIGGASDPLFHRLDNPQPTPLLNSLGLTADARSILYVGGFGPHKNLEALVRVFAKLAPQEKFSDVRMVMVGEHDKEVFHSSFGTIKQQVEELGIADRVIFTGYLPDEGLLVLLNLGTVLVLPSLMEGFGLPAVEAAACGCPVIATTASPLPGLLREGGIYIDPTDAVDLETALTRVLESRELRQRMTRAGMAAAQQLTWDQAARQLKELIEKVGAG